MAAANAAGTALSALALIDTCIRSFRSVKLAMSFRKDYDTCLVRLDIVCWKLATWRRLRWDDSLNNNKTCTHFLQEIDNAFESAQKFAQAYERKEGVDAEAEINASIVEEESISEHAFQLRNRINEQIQGGAKSVSLGKRTKWVLYEHDQLESLITNVTENVNHLTNCFSPQPEEALDSERVNLVNSVTSRDQLLVFQRASRDTDEPLNDAVSARLAMIEGNSYEGFTTTGKGVVIGNDLKGKGSLPTIVLKSSSYKKFRVKGEGSVVGNKIRFG